ncbi:MAG: rod-binding protein [Armatimonadetes bacterium]|nr:rod-binding protein [Armatimonadota bacterium]
MTIGLINQFQQPDLDAVRRTPEAQKELHRLRKATRGVEAIFLKMLISEMRKGSVQSMFGDSLEAKIYADFLDEAVAAQVASGRGIGIGDMLYQRMEEILLRQLAAQEMVGGTANADVPKPDSSMEVNR